MSIKDKITLWWLKGLMEDTWRRKITLAIAKRKIDAYFRRFENMENKKWYESKTVWFNIISGIGGVGGGLSPNPGGFESKVQGIFARIVSIGNIAIRFVTDAPIGEEK